jgi:hypothetical protein
MAWAVAVWMNATAVANCSIGLGVGVATGMQAAAPLNRTTNTNNSPKSFLALTFILLTLLCDGQQWLSQHLCRSGHWCQEGHAYANSSDQAKWTSAGAQ